jgi:hypothetical protein
VRHSREVYDQLVLVSPGEPDLQGAQIKALGLTVLEGQEDGVNIGGAGSSVTFQDNYFQ